jgi:xanthosine utilization system XapX-like protein
VRDCGFRLVVGDVLAAVCAPEGASPAVPIVASPGLPCMLVRKQIVPPGRRLVGHVSDPTMTDCLNACAVGLLEGLMRINSAAPPAIAQLAKSIRKPFVTGLKAC